VSGSNEHARKPLRVGQVHTPASFPSKKALLLHKSVFLDYLRLELWA
jgi:hypothetical protein